MPEYLQGKFLAESHSTLLLLLLPPRPHLTINSKHSASFISLPSITDDTTADNVAAVFAKHEGQNGRICRVPTKRKNCHAVSISYLYLRSHAAFHFGRFRLARQGMYAALRYTAGFRCISSTLIILVPPPCSSPHLSPHLKPIILALPLSFSIAAPFAHATKSGFLLVSHSDTPFN